jgi:hypothetical protein
VNAAQSLYDSFTPGLIDVNGKVISDPTSKPFWKGGLAFLNQLHLHDAVVFAEQLFCAAVKRELKDAGIVGAEVTEDTPRATTAAIFKVIAKAIERKDIVSFDPRLGEIEVAFGVRITMPVIMSTGNGEYLVIPASTGREERVQAEVSRRMAEEAGPALELQEYTAIEDGKPVIKQRIITDGSLDIETNGRIEVVQR